MVMARNTIRPAAKSILASLRISNEKPPANPNADALQKFAETVERQLEYVHLEMEGKELPVMGGEQRQARPRLWYWKKGGQFYITVQYGNMKLDVTGNRKLLALKSLEQYKEQAHPTIHAGESLEDVEDTLTSLREAAVETKELAPFIDHLAEMIGVRLQAARSNKSAIKRKH